MKIIPCTQYSPEWWSARAGIPTASQADRILTPGGKPSAQAEAYICELVAEVFCAQPEFFTDRAGHTAAQRNGINYEPEARRYFEMDQGETAPPPGFITNDAGTLGCSPDGMVRDLYPLELKVPLAKTHVCYLTEGGLPKDYRPQVHMQLIVTGAPLAYFMSYCPGLPPLILEVQPDEYTEKLRRTLDTFLKDYHTALAEMKRRMQT